MALSFKEKDRRQQKGGRKVKQIRRGQDEATLPMAALERRETDDGMDQQRFALVEAQQGAAEVSLVTEEEKSRPHCIASRQQAM